MAELVDHDAAQARLDLCRRVHGSRENRDLGDGWLGERLTGRVEHALGDAAARIDRWPRVRVARGGDAVCPAHDHIRRGRILHHHSAEFAVQELPLPGRYRIGDEGGHVAARVREEPNREAVGLPVKYLAEGARERVDRCMTRYSGIAAGGGQGRQACEWEAAPHRARHRSARTPTLSRYTSRGSMKPSLRSAGVMNRCRSPATSSASPCGAPRGGATSNATDANGVMVTPSRNNPIDVAGRYFNAPMATRPCSQVSSWRRSPTPTPTIHTRVMGAEEPSER